MKRIIGILLALCLLSGFSALADEDEFGENWDYLESRFGYSLWYNADQLTCWTEEWNGDMAEMLCPWEDESGVAVMICRGSRFSDTLWDDWTRIDLDEDALYIYLDYPYEVTAYTDGEVIAEQWIVSAADCDYVFIFQYEVDDPENWALLFRDTLYGLEFPFHPAENACFRLDFFQGGAAGMQFIDIVLDEDAESIVLMPLEAVTDFALESVDWEDFEDYTATPVLLADTLSPGQNLRIYCYIPDMLPDLRFRYTDPEGNDQCWYISQSGRDGSLILIAEDEL